MLDLAERSGGESGHDEGLLEHAQDFTGGDGFFLVLEGEDRSGFETHGIGGGEIDALGLRPDDMRGNTSRLARTGGTERDQEKKGGYEKAFHSE